jgi:hypothetical protein
MLTGSPMATRRISKSTVDSLFCPGGKDRNIVLDDKLKGFGVIVYPTGLKAMSPSTGRMVDRTALSSASTGG